MTYIIPQQITKNITAEFPLKSNEEKLNILCDGPNYNLERAMSENEWRKKKYSSPSFK